MTSPNPESPRPLIVVADDDDRFLATIQQLLEANGLRVIGVRDGQEAMIAIRQHTPALVIADVMMPRLDGFQLCRLIKFDRRLKTIPVILLTARAQEADRYVGRGVGADEYLTKPFKTQRLLNCVTRWLQKPAS